MVNINTDTATVSDMIDPKAQFTQTFFANQDEMIASSWRVTQMAHFLVNQSKLSLLTSNAGGAVRPMEVIISCTEMILKKTSLLRDAVKQMTEAEHPMDETDLILKSETPVSAETWDLVDVQLKINDDGLELFKALCSGDPGKTQTLLSVSNVQSYTNYTDLDGRTSPFKSVSQGDDLIVAQLITTHCRLNVDLAKTTDWVTPLCVTSFCGHASVTSQLIEARCNVDLALKTNGATPLHITAFKGHGTVIKQLIAARCIVDLQDKDGCTSFFIAAKRGHVDIVEQLINVRSKIDLVSTSGLTVMSIATRKGHPYHDHDSKMPHLPQQG
jgi:hypothetical protein